MISPGGTSIGPDSACLDATTRDAVIGELVTQVARHYLFPAMGAQVAEAIRRRQEAGEYDAITHPATLAETLTRHFRDTSQDRHFRVLYPPPPRPPGVHSRAGRPARRSAPPAATKQG